MLDVIKMNLFNICNKSAKCEFVVCEEIIALGKNKNI